MNDYDRQDLIKQRAGLEPPAHEGDYWSGEDRARLKRLFDMGFGISEIALAQGTTRASKRLPVQRMHGRPGGLHHPPAAESSKGGRVMFEDYPDILSPEEAADALRIGENAIYELLNSKKLSAYKNGRNWLIPKEAVRKYVVEQSKLE